MNRKFTPCKVEGCARSAHPSSRGRRGLCLAHYSRYLRHGDPLGGRKQNSNGEAARFIREVVVPYQGKDCLAWPYSKERQGRGIARIDGKTRAVHRYVCQLVRGDPPTPKHEAAHSCGNGHLGCVNPNHLSWKTKVENEADKLAHGTHSRGERCTNSKLTEAQVREILRLKGVKSHAELAVEFAVSKSAISLIHCRRNWAWLVPVCQGDQP